MNIPRLIAHRGYAKNYPENTLIALEMALQAGACAVEFDVQLTRDGVPVLCHDDTLERTADTEGDVSAMTWRQLQNISVHESARFGKRFEPTPIPALAEIAVLLQRYPRATACVEIKEESLRAFGTEVVVKAVLDALQVVMPQCVVISFDEAALRAARAVQPQVAIGWVLPRWDEKARATARALAPQYLFCDQKILPAQGVLWPGKWQWAIYEITDPELALSLAQRGIDWIETMVIVEMLQHPQLRQRACFADHSWGNAD